MKHSHGNERRKHVRLPVMKNIAKPVELLLGKSTTPAPAILLDLSAGGMGLLSFIPIKEGSKVCTKIDLPGLKTNTIEGKVMWDISKEETFRIGISFTKIEDHDFNHIEKMAEDFVKCETKIVQAEHNICFPKCRYHAVCDKSIKK
ncbi:MAG: PilZ domain-containing protein [Elusimicrobiota bacterium]